MTPPHSASVLLVWRLAELEARHLRAQELEPGHFLLGLCKLVDIDLVRLVDSQAPGRDAVLEELLRETRHLRRAFDAAGLDPKAFRRRFRKLQMESNFAAISPETLRRTPASRSAFRLAEQLAAHGGGRVYPLHLLMALLDRKDAKRDCLLEKLNSAVSILLAEARKHCIPPSVPPPEVGMN